MSFCHPFSDEDDRDRDAREPEPFEEDGDRKLADAEDRIATYLAAKAKLKTEKDPAEQKRLLHALGDNAPRTPSEWTVLEGLRGETSNG